MTTIKELFLEECDKLKETKEIVMNTLKIVPNYFYTIPSSSTGKYHPTDENRTGGLLIHTLRTIKVATAMKDLYGLTSQEFEMCRAALLLHDTFRSGESEDETEYTKFEHPIIAAKNIVKANPDNVLVEEIASLVSSHMGQWNTNKYSSIELPLPQSKLQKFVHLCDYIASKREFHIDVGLDRPKIIIVGIDHIPISSISHYANVGNKFYIDVKGDETTITYDCKDEETAIKFVEELDRYFE